MGYVIKVQKISRTRSTSYYANIPTAVVETMEIEKAEEMEWILEDRDTLILRRTKGSGGTLRGDVEFTTAKWSICFFRCDGMALRLVALKTLSSSKGARNW